MCHDIVCHDRVGWVVPELSPPLAGTSATAGGSPAHSSPISHTKKKYINAYGE